MKIQSSSIARSRFDMLPLMDCMFLILLFFVIATVNMVVQSGLSLSLPQSQQSHSLPDTATVISITDSGELALNKSPITLSEIGPYVMNHSNQSVIIQAHAHAQHQWVVNVMDELQRHHIESVSIQTTSGGSQ